MSYFIALASSLTTIPRFLTSFVAATAVLTGIAGCDPPAEEEDGASTLGAPEEETASTGTGTDEEFRNFILVAKLLTAKDVSGDECGSSPVCQCKTWGTAGGGGYQYGVCSVNCATDYGVGNPVTACPAQTPSCIQGKCYETCTTSMSCEQDDATCITPNGKDSICAFHP